MFIAYGFDFIYNLRNSTNAMKLTLFSILIFLIFGVAVSKAQIGEKVPRKGNNKEYYFSILDDNGQQWLLKPGSTRVKVILKSDTKKKVKRKGVFMDMDQSSLGLDTWPDIQMSEIQSIVFKPSVNHSGKLLATYYFLYVGTFTYLIYFTVLTAYEGYGAFLVGTIIVAPIFGVVPLLINQILSKHPKIELQPIGGKFNLIQ